MTEKTKRAMTDIERQRLTLERLKAAGGKKISVKLSKRAVDVLERLRSEFGTQNEAVEFAILQHEQRNLL